MPVLRPLAVLLPEASDVSALRLHKAHCAFDNFGEITSRETKIEVIKITFFMALNIAPQIYNFQNV